MPQRLPHPASPSTTLRALAAAALAGLFAIVSPRHSAAQTPLSEEGGSAQVIDRVIATVGGELLLLSEHEEQLALLASQEGRAITQEVRCGVLENLLTGKLLVNQSKLDSIEVTEDEVEAQLDARFERILGLMNNDLKQFEEYYGQTVSEVRAQFRDDLRNQLLADRMRNQVVSAARITPSEVKAFFEEIPRDSLPFFGSEVELRELVYKPKVSEAAREAARARIDALRARVVDGGEDFAELARKNSQDPGSGRAGGELGWAPRGTFVPEFEAAAYRLEVDEVSEVVESPFGFHIIQLLERRGNRVRTRHILIKPEITRADLTRAEAVLDSVRGEILRDSLLFRDAVRALGEEQTQSYSNGGRMINPATGNTFYEIGDLDPIIFFSVDTLEVGGVTGPVPFEQPGRETLYKIFQLDSRSTPHQASLQRDYDRIRKAAIESKKAEILAEWVEQTIATTFIQVDRSLVRDCGLRERWFPGEVTVGRRP